MLSNLTNSAAFHIKNKCNKIYKKFYVYEKMRGNDGLVTTQINIFINKSSIYTESSKITALA